MLIGYVDSRFQENLLHKNRQLLHQVENSLLKFLLKFHSISFNLMILRNLPDVLRIKLI